jgi:hypothetical protein
MSLDFMHWTRHVPGIDRFWQSIAAQVGPFAVDLLARAHCPASLRGVAMTAVCCYAAWCFRQTPILVMGMDSASILFLFSLQVLGEDLVLVAGQQDRMSRGADVWANPVSYDKLGVRYRRWRNSGGLSAAGQPRGVRETGAAVLSGPAPIIDRPACQVASPDKLPGPPGH